MTKVQEELRVCWAGVSRFQRKVAAMPGTAFEGAALRGLFIQTFRLETQLYFKLSVSC